STPLIETLSAAALLLVGGCVNLPDPDLDADTDGTDGTVGSDDDGGPGTGTSGADDESGSSGAGDCALIEQADVDDDLTLPAGCYVVELPLFAQDITLSMEAGVDITFASGAGLTLSNAAVLTAVGSPDDPVVLHGESDDAASWAGVSLVDAPSSSNRLENVVIDGAASVSVSANSRLTVVASELTGSEEIGLEAVDGAELSISGSTFSGHERPLAVGISAAPGVAADNVFSDNVDASVLVTGNSMTDAATWAALAVPWELDARVTLSATLTLEPGATVMVGQDNEIHVSPDGQLNAVGTAEAPITFTGVQSEVGYWGGIEFASNSSNNVLEYAIVEYAGGVEWYGGGDAASALYIPEEGRLTLRNSTIRYSEWYGLLTDDNAQIGEFVGNTFAESQRAMKIAPELCGTIDGGTVFDEIAEPVVHIGVGGAQNVRTAQTWAALSVPYRVTSNPVRVDADLTLEAGLVFEGAQDRELNVREGGTLHAAGTAESPVVFTGIENVAGYWKGIEFESNSPDNLLENTVVEYAGSSGWYGGADREAAIHVDAEALVELDGVEIRDSAGNGILVNGSLTCSGATFAGIAKDNVSIDGGTGACS
ncbi:MAG: hypothetical protein AAF721_33590, partial [Myxococcota bacterium]